MHRHDRRIHIGTLMEIFITIKQFKISYTVSPEVMLRQNNSVPIPMPPVLLPYRPYQRITPHQQSGLMIQTHFQRHSRFHIRQCPHVHRHFFYIHTGMIIQLIHQLHILLIVCPEFRIKIIAVSPFYNNLPRIRNTSIFQRPNSRIRYRR